MGLQSRQCLFAIFSQSDNASFSSEERLQEPPIAMIVVYYEELGVF